MVGLVFFLSTLRRNVFMEDMIIFGAGKAGFRAKRDVKGKFCVKYFADNDKKKGGQTLDGTIVT